MKIGILTIIDYNNYGNRLQNYAMQEVLKSLGNDVVTVKNLYVKQPNKTFVTQFKKLSNFSKVSGKIRKKFFERKYEKINLRRAQNFMNFTNHKIQETTKAYYGVNDDFSDLKDIDCYVIGSDQVWNYNFSRFSAMDFAAFTEKFKIAYAASFGIYNIPVEKQEIYTTGLNQLDYVSVREDAGKKIVESLSNKKAEVVLDPTLLLKKDQWLGLTQDKPKYQKKYIVTYFLNAPSESNRKYITSFAKKHGCEIKSLGKIEDEMWTADPADFVNLFSQADAVFTDSFHACVFSIIFHKQFEVFERNGVKDSMNSRMDTLLGQLKLEDRWHLTAEKAQNKIDYAQVDLILEKRQAESMKFLTDALNAVKNN